jgi:hypothetical protein
MEHEDKRENDASLDGVPPGFEPLDFTFASVAAEVPDLVASLAAFNGVQAVSTLAGLLTVPAYEPWALRLEVLTCLAVAHARGQAPVGPGDVDAWLAQVGTSSVGRFEDPPEDLFVSRVHDHRGDHRVLTGLWDDAPFYTQLVADMVQQMPDAGRAIPIKRVAAAVLSLSDLVCSRANLSRYQVGTDIAPPPLSDDGELDFHGLGRRVLFSTGELEAAGIDPDALGPVLISLAEVASLAQDAARVSALHLHPVLYLSGQSFLVAMPGSLTLALRHYVIEAMAGGEHVFDHGLHLVTARSIASTPFLGTLAPEPVAWKQIGDHRVGSALWEVDVGHFLTIGFILPSVRTHADGGFLLPGCADAAFEAGLGQAGRDAVEQAEARPGFRAGLQLWVICGWGKGFEAALPDLPGENWTSAFLGIADLARVSTLAGMSPAYLWKALEGAEVIKDAGLTLVNMSGLPNLLAWMRQLHGHFVPHGQMRGTRVSPENPGDFVLPTDSLRSLRIESDQALDRHSAVDPSGNVHQVQHPSNDPLFEFGGGAQLYVSMTAALAGDMVVLFEGANTYWVRLDADGLGAFRSELFDLVLIWLPRVAMALDAQVGALAASYQVALAFDDSSKTLLGFPSVSEEALGDLVVLDFMSMTARFSAGFLTGTRLKNNTAERLVARAMAALYARAVTGECIEAFVESLMDVIVPGAVSRHMHMIRARTFADRIQKSLVRPVVGPTDVDVATVRVGLGWRGLPPGSDGVVSGKDACSAFFARLVPLLLDDVQKELAQYARDNLLVRLLENLERAALDDAGWRRTSASLLELSSSAGDATGVLVGRLSQIAKASLTSRILAEIALCACPAEGDVVSDLVIARLLAKVMLVYQFGGFSDAIHFNVLSPELQVSAMGDVLIQDDFGHFVVTPMLVHAVGRKVLLEAPGQQENYGERAAPVSAEGALDETFYRAWTEETGCDIDSARDIIGALDDAGTDAMAPVLSLRRSAVVALGAERGVDQAKVLAFLDQFTLMQRPRWEDVPLGFSRRELYPWRLGRRLSAMTRPILEIESGPDPLLLVAPGSLQRGFTYVVDQTFFGRLRPDFFKSHLMRNVWLGTAGEGHTFNHEVATALRNAGWAIRENLSLPELLGRPMVRDFGDIDVLAWREDRAEVLVVECKDLSLARNHSEVAALLSEFQGKSAQGKPDRLRKHLNRIDVVALDLDRVGTFTRLTKATIVPWFVFSGPVPMQYARIDALDGIRVGAIEDVVRY